MSDSVDPHIRHRGRSLIASVYVPFAFTISMMTLRFYARYLRRSLKIDDWIMLSAFVIYTILVGLTTELVVRGSLKHIWTIPPRELGWIIKVSNIAAIFGAWSVMLAKVAVGMLILGLMSGNNTKWRHWIIWTSTVVYALATFVLPFVIFFQCDPPRALWHPELVAAGLASCPRSYINTNMSILQSSLGIWTDFILALLPVTFIYKLNMPLSKKIAICILLSLGILAGACAIIKTTYFTDGFATTDPTYNTYPLFFWACLEIPFVIIAGCVPPVKPVFDRLFHGRPIRGRYSASMGPAPNNSNNNNDDNNNRESKRWHWYLLGSRGRGSQRSTAELSDVSKASTLRGDGVRSSTGNSDDNKDDIKVDKTFSVERQGATPPTTGWRNV